VPTGHGAPGKDAHAAHAAVGPLPDRAPLTRAVDHLVHESIGAIPIVDESQRLVGIVSYVDVIQALRRKD
jgi:CBS-domain-containing membrane protein